MRLIGMPSACVLIRASAGRYKEVFEAVRNLKGVVKIFPVLGRFDIVVDVEAESYSDLASLVRRIGRIGGVAFTETLVEMEVV
ncbi:Lrp/AsnC ligand binding domain-containing protein [Candidatus Bathyarchaeota archaeon]|nr:Lrp/AsnC ligand binding domain-containing protein [Candidatus Bathyarchaeota archaeon]